MDEGFAHWLAGFIDGEGCFAISRRQRVGYASYVPVFKLVLRDDDQQIIHEIVERTALGRMFTPTRNPQDRGKPQVGWMVDRKQDLLGLVALLDAHPLRAKKARDYGIWRAAVLHWAPEAWHVGGVRGPRDWSQMQGFADELRETRRYIEAA